MKTGVFEDMVNGYPVEEYKRWVNAVSDIETAKPSEVAQRIRLLLDEYNQLEKISLVDLAKLHADFEAIHPFQDGNVTKGYQLKVA